jgi:phage tail-like protein
MPVAIVEAKNRTDPIPGFSFTVEIGGEIQGWFTECTGLSVERKVDPKPEGGVNDFVHQLPGRLQQSKITLKHGLAGNELWEWFQKGMYDAKVERRNISIVLYNSDLTKKKWWDLDNAFPVKWTGPSLASDKVEITVESLELVHHGLKMNDWANVQA